MKMNNNFFKVDSRWIFKLLTLFASANTLLNLLINILLE